MAASNYKVYDEFKELGMDGSIDVDGDTFKQGLMLSTSNAATLTTSGWANITNKVSGNGYAEQTLTQTWTKSGSTVTFDADDAVFTASGGSITARFTGIYDDTPTTPVIDPLVCHAVLDDTPADVTATDGNSITVAQHASGIYTLSGAVS